MSSAKLKRFILEETGEIRAPQRGEYYIDVNGLPQRAEVHFSSWSKYPIIRLGPAPLHSLYLDEQGLLWLHLKGKSRHAAVCLSVDDKHGPIVSAAIAEVAEILKECNRGQGKALTA